MDELDKFMEWIETKHPTGFITLQLLRKWVPIYRRSVTKEASNG